MAVKQITTDAKCRVELLDQSLLGSLDKCYEEDIKTLVKREITSKIEKVSLSSEGDWEYWSITDSVLFCFTVITTIGKLYNISRTIII